MRLIILLFGLCSAHLAVAEDRAEFGLAEECSADEIVESGDGVAEYLEGDAPYLAKRAANPSPGEGVAPPGSGNPAHLALGYTCRAACWVLFPFKRMCGWLGNEIPGLDGNYEGRRVCQRACDHAFSGGCTAMGQKCVDMAKDASVPPKSVDTCWIAYNKVCEGHGGVNTGR